MVIENKKIKKLEIKFAETLTPFVEKLWIKIIVERILNIIKEL